MDTGQIAARGCGQQGASDAGVSDVSAPLGGSGHSLSPKTSGLLTVQCEGPSVDFRLFCHAFSVVLNCDLFSKAVTALSCRTDSMQGRNPPGPLSVGEDEAPHPELSPRDPSRPVTHRHLEQSLSF